MHTNDNLWLSNYMYIPTVLYVMSVSVILCFELGRNKNIISSFTNSYCFMCNYSTLHFILL